MLRFTNTLSGEVEDFVPLDDKKVRLYMCGPTVWDFAHIGNFRTFTFGDVLQRYLRYKGYDVTYVMNVTDVDDRIINEAAKKGISIGEMTAPFTVAFNEDMAVLGNQPPDIQPHATEHIPEMIAIIEKLLASGKAYESDGSIYFRITEFPSYGKLAKIKFEGNIAGGSERIDTDKYDKEDARDFALWKLVDENDPNGWEAPFGRGRPGWHIECSAMSMKYLGETFDIHAGGADLKFPHHENEIAQSEGSTGKLFAKYWLHGEFLNVDNSTMSKSLGNAHTLRDVMAKGFSPLAIRYLLLSAPYKKQLNFTFEGLKGAETTVARLRQFRRLVTDSSGDEAADRTVGVARETGDENDTGRISIKDRVNLATLDFEHAMDDDLNTARALAAIHDLVSDINARLAEGPLHSDDREEVLGAVEAFESVLGIFGAPDSGEILDEDIEKLIAERETARANRDFGRSDEIRDELAKKGIVLEDTKDGVRWKRGHTIP